MNLHEIIEEVKLETQMVLALPEPEPEPKSPNSSFSTQLPNLQLGMDSTSYGNLKICPRYYYYNNVLGRVPAHENAHLIWGRVYQAGLEEYDKQKAAGRDHEESVIAAVRLAFIQTWNPKLRRPWTSEEPTKTRETVIRALIWHMDKYKNDPLETLILSNGKPAVELSFRFPSGFKSRVTGEDFILCGHLDRAGTLHGKKRILDHKSTIGSIGQEYFAKYSPDNQVSQYLTAGSIIFEEPVLDMIIDVCQAKVHSNEFQRGFVSRTQAQLDEWLRGFGLMMQVAELYAEAGEYPMNDRACGMYSRYDGDHDTWSYGCPYRKVCAAPNHLRPQILDKMFVQRVWDPLVPR